MNGDTDEKPLYVDIPSKDHSYDLEERTKVYKLVDRPSLICTEAMNENHDTNESQQ